MPKWVTQILAPLLCGTLLLLGVVALNSLLRGYFRDKQRCMMAFQDIACEPPAKMSRTDFLAEVQFTGNWPDDINLLDDGLLGRLQLSFAVNPWVEAVEFVKITPPHQIRVVLRYRVPTLAVVEPGDNAPAWIIDRDGETKLRGRVVDRNGVLLPLAANDPDLPVLFGKIPPPTGQTGQPWGDGSVARVAAVAAQLAPHQEQVGIKQLEIDKGVLILFSKHTRVIWGKVDVEEPANEAPAEMKVQRLLEFHEQSGSLNGRAIDLRGSEK